jgi:magnesium transporter
VKAKAKESDMLRAYVTDAKRLSPMPDAADLAPAVWIDLYRPSDDQVAQVTALGIEIPTLADMEEIEISNRLYRADKADYLTIVLPGSRPDKSRGSGPVTFILTSDRMVTVRHHVPRPFDTFPDRADRSGTGCGNHLRIFLGLVEEIVSRLADLLEGTGKALDSVSEQVFSESPGQLRRALEAIGREGEALAHVRLGLLTVERMLSTFGVWADDRKEGSSLRPYLKAMMRDIQALEVHVDFLSSRVSLTNDTTMGMINLEQNKTVRIVSVVAALFLPPTLIASVYGMNFAVMPELALGWGYPLALALMVGSALVTYAYFKWRGWL